MQKPQEKKWVKPRAGNNFTLPNETEKAKEYKKAVEQGRNRLRLDFTDRNGFDFLLSQTSLLQNLKETSYSEKGPDNTIIVHLYYIREKRGRIIDFQTEKWEPYLREVTVDRGLISKTVDLQDELSSAIVKLKPKPKDKEIHPEEGELENEMELEKKNETEPTETEAEIRRRKKKRKRELQKEAGTGSDLFIERNSEDLKKLKNEQEEKKMELLQKKVHILESSLRQLVKFTGKIIGMVRIQGPEDGAVLKQEFSGILHTLQQQDSEMALGELEFEFDLEPDPDHEPQLSINPEEQAVHIKELEELFPSSSSKKCKSKSQTESEPKSLLLQHSSDNGGNSPPSTDLNIKAASLLEGGELERKVAAGDDGEVEVEEEKKCETQNQSEAAAVAKASNKKPEKKMKKPPPQQQQPLPSGVTNTAEKIKQRLAKNKLTPAQLLEDKNTPLEWIAVLRNHPELFE